jgi:hypothetical protein
MKDDWKYQYERKSDLRLAETVRSRPTAEACVIGGGRTVRFSKPALSQLVMREVGLISLKRL